MNKKILLLGSALLLTTALQANELSGSVGIGAGVVQSPYRGIGRQAVPIPDVNISYGDLYLKAGDIPYTALGFGYNFFKSEKVILGASINMGGFDVDRSEMDSGYNNLDKRDTQIEMALKATVYTGWNGIIAEGYGSMGEEGGHLGSSLLRPLQVTSRLTLIPKVSFTYFESDYAEYYFGVTEKEANRSGNHNIGRAYDPGSAYIYGANLTANYAYSETTSFFIFTGIDKLSTDIRNSPIVEKDTLYKGGAGVTYRF